jgi:uncharacterized protein YkwD
MFAAVLIAATVSAGTCDLAAAQTVIDDVNVHRNAARMQALAVDPQLTAVAMDRAADLVRRHYFAHVSPDGSTAIDGLRSRAFPFGYAGENLAEAGSVQAAEQGLWASPDHRDNMLGAHYRRIGIAVVRTGDGEIVVQIFTD